MKSCFAVIQNIYRDGAFLLVKIRKKNLEMREEKKSVKENEIEKILGNNKYYHFCLLSV